MGLLGGGPQAMNADEVSAYLEGMAQEINGADGGLRYDDFSKLINAVHVEKQITIRGDSLLNMDKLGEGYLDSRKDQAANKLCSDADAAAALAGGATFVYNWFSADNQDIGMVTVRGTTFCEENGYSG
ncbi:MAG TPA: hypothetical protein ENJ52_14005 [Aliiroseovarius sp.]|nr:hypothetical protein [Aliiroseovarius sp.]